MAALLDGVFEGELQKKVATSRILVVGAGGVGCEVLKNLVMCAFQNIEIIDLDTIEVSNLNRQFLFHREHVGKSKAQVARESALAFNPDTNIVAHHDSITDTKFGVTYFQGFDVVLNALDNRVARNHVNRMCLTAKVPLIETGTSGYNGQVELIQKGVTPCYECTPKAKEKTFPGCTIRNTPSELIHCIVWAKHLFNQLFGEDNADEDVSPDTADPEAAGDAGQEALETQSNNVGNVERQSTRAWAQSIDYDSEKLFNKLFHDDIKYLLSMANLWKKRTPPEPLKFGVGTATGSQTEDYEGMARDQKVWNLEKSTQVFSESVSALRSALKALPSGDTLVWDKDDADAMDFVTSCACIRATIFHIATKNRFEVKSMAGNIIPAIATTNAIAAGMAVLHLLKVLKGQIESCQSVYMRLRPNPQNQIIVREKFLAKPNPECAVCSVKPQIVVRVNVTAMLVGDFRKSVLLEKLGTKTPDVILDGKGAIVISSEEGEEDLNDAKLLQEMGIVDGCILKVDDFQDNNQITLVIVNDEKQDAKSFEVTIDAGAEKKIPEEEEEKEISREEPEEEEPAAKKPRMEDSEPGSSKQPVEDDDSDLEIIESDDEVPAPTTSTAGTKRKSGLEKEEEPTEKKQRVIETFSVDDDDDDVVWVD
ncbi:SUMO-activating enzyme subunit 2 [Phlebotomus argentipes]|uniref:SUMO-activating enzyme subunit 2 n=1 Tax=Phlebotomus argentipes TaxID=94469 RepID=UPI0028932E6B|nr:SUMO-activating enzyme subunit 2 [Phlebotomus argentipes]